VKSIRSLWIGLTGALTLGLVHSPDAAAHHGWSGYDEKAQQLEGTVREVRFGNPHVTIQLASGDDVWLVVLAPPSRMQSRGLPDGTLQVGSKVTVEGYAHREKRNEMRAEWITVGDKKQVPLR
jgi:Family of unknown function (DUF6152)